VIDMADNSLRGLAKAYFNGDYEWDTYIQQRSQLIDKITKAPIVDKQSSIPIVKYAIVAGMILLFFVGALGVFWVLKEPKAPLSEDSEPQAAPTDTESIAPDVAEPQTEPPPPSEAAQQEEGGAGNLDESQAANTEDIEAPTVEPEPESQAANTEDIEAPTVEPEPVETKTPVLLEPTPEALTEQDKAKIVQLLRECNKHLKAKRLVTGNQGTALVCYREVLAIESDNAEALDGLKAIEQRYETWAERALDKKRFRKAKGYLERLETVNPDSPALADLKQRLEAVQ